MKSSVCGPTAASSVEQLSHDPERWDELAEFLANFVSDGQLHDPLPGDDKSEIWRQRMDWWWKENPFCTPDSPIGLLLRDDSGHIVGFQGLLPLEYEFEGKVIPGLLSCLFFVDERHRAQSMGLFFRIQRLSREFHIVDGGPSEEMVKILERFGYARGGKRTFHFLPPSLVRSPHLPPGCRFISDLSEVDEISTARDARLRKRVTREGLHWLCRVGRHSRSFVGVIDSENCLVAYAIGYHRKLPGSIRAWQILDYGAADESVFSVEKLLRYAVGPRGRRNLPSPPHLIIWGIENGALHPAGWFRKEKESEVYYRRPDSLAEAEKVILPVEGDYCFF